MRSGLVEVATPLLDADRRVNAIAKLAVERFVDAALPRHARVLPAHAFAYHFFRDTSFNTSMSKVRSATTFTNRDDVRPRPRRRVDRQ